jgi:uncharacterized protein (DUF1697 family)
MRAPLLRLTRVRQALLLRGINVGQRRVSMPDLRALLTEAGYQDVSTYVQSGNVVLSSPASPRKLERETEKLMSERFGFEIPVIVRTRKQLAAVVDKNPLRKVAANPKRYQVAFLSAKLDATATKRLEDLRVDPEALVVDGREVYAWHPEGVARSKLWNALAAKSLGVTCTARNWTTVCKLLEMTED